MDLPTAIRYVLRCRTGNEFQATVQEILRHRIKGFQAVEPYGDVGDGGNDGYSRDLGLYAQIYAPLSQKASARDAARKAARDFAKLRRKWHRISPIKDFWFVMNAPASNIHLEEALSLIERRHGIKARFVGASELADEAMKINRSRLEQVMGFKVAGKGEATGTFPTPGMLSNVDPKYLDALHLLAALAYPVVPELCQSLLPQAVDWTAFWRWLRRQGWVTRHGRLLHLDKEIVGTCHRNKIAQQRACEAWVPVLLAHGSVDCLYLSIRPLVMLSRLVDAVRVIADAGTRLADSGWDESMFTMWEVFNKPKLLRKLSASDRFAFELAGANLLATSGRDEEAFNAFSKAFQRVSSWPRSLNRPLMTLNFGVAAHRSGRPSRAAELYAEAAKLSRRSGDYWVLGRAASNLAQAVLSTDPARAAALLDESEVAKKSVKDHSGLAIVAMVRGLIAAEQDNPTESSRHFERAKQQLAKVDDRGVLADLAFNLAKSYGELGQWQDAVQEYRASLKAAEGGDDAVAALRARNGLAESFSHLEDWRACRRECEALARLPEDTKQVDYRLAGLHGLLLVAIHGQSTDDIDVHMSRALEYARRTNREEWISRILVDRHLSAKDSTSKASCQELLSAARMEFKARRISSAMTAARAVWSHAVRGGDLYSDIEDVSKSLLDSLAIRSGDVGETIDLLKWQYGVRMAAGDPLRAAKCLEDASTLAKMASLWDEYVAAIDQQAVVLAELERPDLAVPLHREALRIAKTAGLSNEERTSAANLAECLRRLGRLHEALKASKASLALQDVTNDPERYLSSLHNHYLILRELGRRREAATALRRCESVARKHSIWQEVLKALMARGNAAWDADDFTTAEKLYRRALKEATRRGIEGAAADCRYNLAILLRKRGRVTDALDVLQNSPEPPFDVVHSLHRLTLKALLLEDVGRLEDSWIAWSGAACIGERIEDADQHAYCHTRAILVKTKPNDTPKQRANIADHASELIRAIYKTSARGKHIQRAYDDAQTYVNKEQLEHYRVRAYQAVADRLSVCRHERNLTAATQASIASLIAAIGDERQIGLAMQVHVRWLLSLDVPSRRLAQLRAVAGAWLRRTLRSALRGHTKDLLLSGFTAVGRFTAPARRSRRQPRDFQAQGIAKVARAGRRAPSGRTGRGGP